MSEMSEQVVEFVKAGFSGIWVHTNEQEDAMSDLIASAMLMSGALGSGISVKACGVLNVSPHRSRKKKTGGTIGMFRKCFGNSRP